MAARGVEIATPDLELTQREESGHATGEIVEAPGSVRRSCELRGRGAHVARCQVELSQRVRCVDVLAEEPRAFVDGHGRREGAPRVLVPAAELGQSRQRAQRVGLLPRQARAIGQGPRAFEVGACSHEVADAGPRRSQVDQVQGHRLRRVEPGADGQRRLVPLRRITITAQQQEHAADVPKRLDSRRPRCRRCGAAPAPARSWPSSGRTGPARRDTGLRC